ncbi:hypothetical protein KQH61_05460 [bacterium]|nr:hypothetical protein [bacterium]MCB2179349.1 hypothetical protein [bacterium]
MNRQPQVSPSSSPTVDPNATKQVFSDQQKQTLSLIAGFWVISLFTLFFFKNILWPAGGTPWGSDTFGHIFRFTYLQDAIDQGVWFPQTVSQWYLGIELFRYYPPLLYYALAALNSVLQDPITTTNLFIVGAAWFGGVTWLLFHRWVGAWPAILGGCLYITLPDLVRIAFSDGNMQRHLTNALIPLAFFLVLHILQSKAKPATYLGLAGVFGLLVLSHPMMAAIIATMAALLIAIAFLTKSADIRQSLLLLTTIVLGILTTSFWLLPSLTGGITELNPEAVIAGLDIIPLLKLISPFTRTQNIEGFYMGLGVFSLSVIAFLFSLKKRDEVFLLSLTGLVGALLVTPILNPVYTALPLASLMWPLRFLAPASFLLLLASIWFLSRLSKKWVAVLLFAAMFIDGWGGTSLIHLNPPKPDLDQIVSTMAQLPGWREATLDQSRFGSNPSYKISSIGGREQVFGWGFQGAVTAELVASLNEALVKGNSVYLVDRLSMLGVDDLLLPTSLPLPYGLKETLQSEGYAVIIDGQYMDYMHRDGAPRAVQFEAKALAIGQGAQNFAYIFPQVIVGSSDNIQDYTYDELAQFEIVILSGFQWDNLDKAEALVLQVMESGTQVVVDLHNTQEDPVARSPKFLDVWGEKVILPNEPLLAQTKSGSVTLAPFEYEGELWYTITPQGLDQEIITYDYLNSTAVISGVKTYGENQVLFIGANLAYHIITSNDTAAIELLADTLGIPALEVSDYQSIALVNYQATPRGVNFDVQLEAASRLLIPVSSFDGTQVRVDGNLVPFQNYYNLVVVRIPAGTHDVEITTTQPVIYTLGWITSLLALFSLFVLFYLIRKKYREK